MRHEWLWPLGERCTRRRFSLPVLTAATQTRPQVRNPAYRGKWVAPVIANPAYGVARLERTLGMLTVPFRYIGAWKPRRIPNPDYFDNPRPSLDIKPFTAIGVDWWCVQADSAIDNIVLVSRARIGSVCVPRQSCSSVYVSGRVARRRRWTRLPRPRRC